MASRAPPSDAASARYALQMRPSRPSRGATPRSASRRGSTAGARRGSEAAARGGHCPRDVTWPTYCEPLPQHSPTTPRRPSPWPRPGRPAGGRPRSRRFALRGLRRLGCALRPTVLATSATPPASSRTRGPSECTPCIGGPKHENDDGDARSRSGHICQGSARLGKSHTGALAGPPAFL